MENFNLDNLTLEQLAALKREVAAAWDSRYVSAINEVITMKLPNGNFHYRYGEKSYLATRLPNGNIRLFHAKASKMGYKRGEIAIREIFGGFYDMRKLIRFNQLVTA